MSADRQPAPRRHRWPVSGQALAEELGVSYKTVANTCSQIKAKLGVARTVDLVRLSIEGGVA